MMYMDYYRAWLEDSAVSEADKAELQALTDKKEIEDRFYRDLEFGTAGMRGVIGVGRNRFNEYNVGKVTQATCFVE